jgi:DNA-binding HxlR family transcriptional regulator
MSAAELEQREKRERIPVEILDALKARWLQLKQLHAELPHIPRSTLKGQLERLFKAGFLWRREVDRTLLTEFEQRARSTPVYEYRCKFM